MAASTMKSGVRKSGWPMPRLMMSRPCDMSCMARASTAKAFSSPIRSKAATVFSMAFPGSLGPRGSSTQPAVKCKYQARPAGRRTAGSPGPGPGLLNASQSKWQSRLVGAADRVVAHLSRHFAAAVRDGIRIDGKARTAVLRRGVLDFSLHRSPMVQFLRKGRGREQRNTQCGQNQLGVERCHVCSLRFTVALDRPSTRYFAMHKDRSFKSI